MANKPKATGTAAETATLRYVQANGYPWAQRLTLNGNHDRGDIALVPGPAAILEIKAHKTASTGQPGPAMLTQWLQQTETERANSGADIALLVVKRKGTTDPAQWFTYMRLSDITGRGNGRPVCLALADALWLLRKDGYGTPLDQDNQ